MLPWWSSSNPSLLIRVWDPSMSSPDHFQWWGNAPSRAGDLQAKVCNLSMADESVWNGMCPWLWSVQQCNKNLFLHSSLEVTLKSHNAVCDPLNIVKLTSKRPPVLRKIVDRISMLISFHLWILPLRWPIYEQTARGEHHHPASPHLQQLLLWQGQKQDVLCWRKGRRSGRLSGKTLDQQYLRTMCQSMWGTREWSRQKSELRFHH